MSPAHKQTHLPLKALRAFDAVMRFGSMTRAAEALGVTHGAVSRQVQALQAHLSTTLFDGARNARTPTAAARALWGEVGPAFDALHAALETRTSAGRPVRVSCFATLAGRWLIPRLAGWEHGAAVELTESHAAIDASLAGCDVAIRMLGPGEKPPRGLEAVAFMENHTGPVAVPGVEAATARRLLPRSYPQAIEAWTGLTGQRVGSEAPPLLFDHQQTMIEACFAGLGVCVTQECLVWADLASGRLIAPSGFVRDGAVFAAFHRKGPPEREVRRFLEWLKAVGAG